MRHLVVTGGTGGLGKAIATAFSGPDWTVAAPGSAALDVTDPSAISRFFAERPVDLLVCAAGMSRDGVLGRLSETDWDAVMAVNFTGSAACAKAVIPGMIGQGSGHIVFISSHAALHPPVGISAYATAKAALLGLTRELADRHGRQGIRVNAILPGFLETRMTRDVPPQRREAALAEHCLGAFNTPAAVADFIRFLHERLPHTSGQVFQLDSRPAP
ncbi:MAG: SDR family oxidoreductase [Verrucomicrobia bacterium]|nr:SDR family oxidoreductase [Verrucomicrobiota bacterium]